MNTYSGKKYITHFLKANNAHGIHSPFVFDLYNKVIRQKKSSSEFHEIEQLRKELLHDKREITTCDLVQDLLYYLNPKRRIADIAKYFSSPTKDARFFYKLCQYLNPKTILELGTSLGLTTSYLAKAAPEARIVSLEGCPETANIATTKF